MKIAENTVYVSTNARTAKSLISAYTIYSLPKAYTGGVKFLIKIEFATINCYYYPKLCIRKKLWKINKYSSKQIKCRIYTLFITLPYSLSIFLHVYEKITITNDITIFTTIFLTGH